MISDIIRVIQSRSNQLLFGVLIMSVYVHSGILSHFFLHDDFLHFYQAANTGFWKFIMTPTGGHIYQTRNFVFYLFYKLFDLQSIFFFAASLFLHTLNIIFLFKLIVYLTKKPFVGIFGSAIWGIAPVNYGTLGWYSAFGIVLCNLLILLFLLDILKTERKELPITHTRLVTWYFLMLTAATCYGTGLVVATLAAPIVWLLLREPCYRSEIFQKLLPLAFIIPVLYFVSMRVSISHNLENLKVLDLLALSPDYWTGTFLMTTGIAFYGISSMLLGAFTTYGSRGVLSGPLSGMDAITIGGVSIGTSVIFCFFLMYVFIRSDNHKKRTIIGMLLLMGLVYGSIALGRWKAFLIFQQPLSGIIFTARYQYIGTVVVTILLCIVIANIRGSVPGLKREIGLLILAIWIVCLAVFSKQATRYLLKNDGHMWKDEYISVISEIETEIMNNPSTGYIVFHNKPLEKIRLMLNEAADFPGKAALFIIRYPENRVNGRTVLFMEENREIIEGILKKPKGRIHSLLVHPNEVSH